jgi:nicotinate-nucleotide adenylyltransferase
MCLIVDKKTIGIFGGSFDPPHKGHVEISKISLKKIKLKKIYWIITKKNPFKKKPFFFIKTKNIKIKESYKKI